MSARARKSSRSTSPPCSRRLRMVSSISSSVSPPAASVPCRSRVKFSRAQRSMSMLTWQTGRKLPRSTSTFFLYSTSDGCSTTPLGSNIAAPDSPICTSFMLIRRLSTWRNSMPENSIMSIAMRWVVRPSSSDSISASGSWNRKKAPYSRFTPTMPSASCCRAFSLSSMRTWMMIWLAWSRGRDWKRTPIQPWHSLVPLVVAGGHGVGEGEERRVRAAGVAQAVEVQLVFVVQHRLQARPADVAVGLAVDGVADRHVVGRHALGDGPGGAAHPEEPAHHLLPGADLGEGAVAARVQVDLQRLGVGIRVSVVGRSERHGGDTRIGGYGKGLIPGFSPVTVPWGRSRRFPCQ